MDAILGKINTCRLQKIITSRKIVSNLELLAPPSTRADSNGTYFSSWTRSRPLPIFWTQKSASCPNFDLWENFQDLQTVIPHRHCRKVRSCRPQTITKVDPLRPVSQPEQETDRCRSSGAEVLSHVQVLDLWEKLSRTANSFSNQRWWRLKNCQNLLITKADSIGVCKPIPLYYISEFLIF